jgi:hypothetical protein
MAKVKLEVEVSKEAHELVQGLDKFVGALQDALKDGWQMGTDMPLLLSAAFTELVPAIQGCDQLGAEMAEDKKAFVNALGNGLSNIAFRFIK